ncbi:MAG: hypothetical protein FWB80_06605 [Defluviitaleaceae bacterium]|nr:hypothetical protein [Defluviitaleaceae bacterium]
MQSVKAYRIYYDGSVFVPHEPVVIPKGSQAVATILDFPMGDVHDDGKLNDASRRQI